MAAHPKMILVAIPVYNGAQYISDAIRSLLEQSYSHWHLHVYDNASTDNTRDIVQSFNDERIKLLPSDTHLSFSQNWTRCLEEVKGDFFQLLCADDTLHPQCFEKKIKLAEKPENAEIVLFTSNRMLMSKNRRALFEIGYSRLAGRFSRADVMSKIVLQTNPIGDPATGLTRLSALSDIKKFTHEFPFMVDLDFWLQVLRHGDMRHTPEALSFFRISGGALSSSRVIQNLRDYIAFYRQHIKPHFTERKFFYYSGYFHLAWRTVARHVVYLLNR